jgi:hypothetical protein
MGATTGGMSRAAMTFAPAKFAIETRSSTDLPITAAPPVPSATKQQHKNYDDQDHFHGKPLFSVHRQRTARLFAQSQMQSIG